MLSVSHSCFFWTVRKSKFIDKLCSLWGSNFVTTLSSQFPDHVSLSLWNEAEWHLFAKGFDGPYYENCWECSVFLRSLDFNHGAWDCFIKKVSLRWLKKFKAVAVICQMQSFILATIFITDSSLWNNGCPVYKKKVESIPPFLISNVSGEYVLGLQLVVFGGCFFFFLYQGQASELILRGPSKDLMLHVLLCFSLTSVAFHSVLLFLFFICTVKLAVLV